MIIHKLKRKQQEFKYRSHAHPKSIQWNWPEKGYNRIALVNHLIAITGGINANYLEIGCAENSLFDSVASLKKTGVDPVSGGTHRMTSDLFFQNNKHMFDVVFIDGLHDYQQVRRDTLHALKYLNDGGWVAFHNFLPSNGKEHHVPRISGAWTGDCWKRAVELNRATGIDFKIIEIDHGVGVIRKNSNATNIPDLSDELLHAEFDRFIAELGSLPLCSFDEAISFTN